MLGQTQSRGSRESIHSLPFSSIQSCIPHFPLVRVVSSISQSPQQTLSSPCLFSEELLLLSNAHEILENPLQTFEWLSFSPSLSCEVQQSDFLIVSISSTQNHSQASLRHRHPVLETSSVGKIGQTEDLNVFPFSQRA